MSPIVRVLGGAAIIVLLAACGSRISLGPTSPDQGIVVYLNANFSGPSQQIDGDVRDLKRVEGACVESDGEGSASASWNDCISSVRLLPGWGATLYGDRDFQGGRLELVQDVPDLKQISGPCSGSYNDCISSIRVFRR